MKPPPTKRRIPVRIVDCLGAAVALVLIVVLSATGFGPVPALAAVLTPGTGVWHLSPDAGTATSGTFSLPGLQEAGTISFQSDGATNITAGTDQDMFRMIGYVDARFRLVQMDLERLAGGKQALGRPRLHPAGLRRIRGQPRPHAYR